MSLAAKLLVIIFLLCPYVDSEFANLNDLGYASCILTSASYYSLQMIISFALIYCFISMESGKKLTLCMKGICVLTGGVSLVSAVSAGYRVGITVIVPLIVCGIIASFVENRIQRLWEKDMVFMYINLFLAFIGKYIAEHFFHFQSREDIMVLVGLDTFWKNLGSIFLGYFKLLGGMRGDTSVVALSTQGIKYLSRFAVAAMVLIMFAICLYMHLRKKIKCKGLYAVCSVVVFHVVMYAVLYTSYAQTVFEIRYLILPYLGMLICQQVL